MDTWYWVIEYGKVFCGYLFFMFLWPSVVFGGHLKEKCRTYRFSFCVTVQVVIINTVVLILGLFHILDPRITAALFYGVFFAALLRKIILAYGKEKGAGKRIRPWRSIVFRVKECFWSLAGCGIEYAVLGILLIFGMMYFSYGAFQTPSYGFGDLYIHHEWIYGLMEGKIFSAGVYPEAMHCFIYCLDALFGLRVYSSLLFLQGIHVTVFLISAYLLMKEIFHWRYTPLFVLTLFLTLDVVSADQVYSMFRLQITLPLEFGLHTQFLCALFLVRYLKNARQIKRKNGTSRYCWDENLFLFLMSFAASVVIHFYTTIMAFIVCAAFAVFMAKRLFSKEYFIPLAASVLCGGLIAVLPLAGGLASGIPFNYSINWAINSMDGESTRELENEGGEDAQALPKKEQAVSAVPVNALKGIYTKGYAALYGTARANLILCVTLASVILCALAKKRSWKLMREVCGGYPPLLLFTFLFMLTYAAPHIGLPEIISDSRFCMAGHMMILAVLMLPADILFSILVHFYSDRVLSICSAVGAAGIYVLTVLTGHFHGYLFYELTRYNGTVEVTSSIIDSFPEKSYVVVAPTDELYPVIKYGWHEELLRFVQNTEQEGYTLTPEYVFIYVEKKPILYAQAYFFEGPSWLAREKYKDIYWDKYSKKYPDTGATQAPELLASQVAEEEAEKPLIDYGNAWLSYTRLENRTIMESKAYEWCERFKELHPQDMKVYYEDEDFVCYYFRQDDNLQYDLGIN